MIGGYHSYNAQVMASHFVQYNMPFFILATTEHLVRGYSSWGNLWAMVETDITKCEVLLSKAVMYGCGSVALIVREDDAYGQTFIDWFAFQAKELGIVNCGVFTYADGDCSQMKMAFESGSDCVICASTMEEDIAKMIEARNSVQKSTGRYIRTLFSDSVFTPGFIERFGTVCEGMEGVMYSSDPESGFDVAYQVVFNEDSSCGEAQTYDACMLIGLVTMIQRLDGSLDFKSAMRKLVSGRTPVYGTWTAAGMAAFTTSIAAGENPDIIGASGNLNFDSKVFTNVLSTTYCNYIINNLRYVIIDYNSTSGGTRTDPTLAGWNWKAKQMQEIGQGPDAALPELDQRWALLAATSKGWEKTTAIRRMCSICTGY